MTRINPRRALPLVALLCAPCVSTLTPVLSKSSQAILAYTADVPGGTASFNLQGVWGTLTIGGRFDSRVDNTAILSFTVLGHDSSSISVPIDGEVVTYQRITAVPRPRTLRIADTTARGRAGLSLENVSVAWGGPRGVTGLFRDALVAWTAPRGLPGLCYQSMLFLGVLASCATAWRRVDRLGGPWAWWVGAACLVTLFPRAFSPLTRIILPGGVSLSTVVLCGTVAGLVSSVAGGRTRPRLAGLVLLVWATVARLVTCPWANDRRLSDVDEIVYSGVAENILQGHGFMLPDQVYRDPSTITGDRVRDSWFKHELYLGVARRGEPTAAVAPLYSLMLAAFKLPGVHDLSLVYGVQLLFGLSAGVLAGVAGAQLGGPAAGIGAMALALFHSPAVAVTGFLFTESLFLVLLMGACALLLSDRPVPQLFSCGLIGLAVLTRPVALIVAPLWPLYMVIARPRTWRVALVGCGVLGLSLAPWAARNHAVFGEAVVGSTFAGKDFFMGNNDAARRSGAAPSQDWFSLSIRHRRLLRLAGFTPADMATVYDFPVEIPSEVARDKELKRRTALFILAYPDLFLERTGQRIQQFAGQSPRPEPWEHVGQLPFLFIPALGLVTLAFWTGLTRRGTFLAVVAVLLSVAPIASVAYSRYRLPVDLVLFPLAGVGFAAILSRIRPRTGAHES